MPKPIRETYNNTVEKIISLTDLEDSFTNKIKEIETDPETNEAESVITILELMREGVPPLYISEEVGVALFNGVKQLKNLLIKGIPDRYEVEELFVKYNRILYWDILQFEKDLSTKEFDDKTQEFLKNCTYKRFMMYQKDPLFTLGTFITDRKLMYYLHSREAESKTIVEIEKEQGIVFDIDKKVKYWLKSAGIVYINGAYRDLETGEILEFTQK
uniref:hypothetical protein n=1 Tax=Streptococcus pluranimalium TaxID=82348 RepID=UPI003F68BC50